MFIDQYCTSLKDDYFSFTRQQASDFARHVANDFNPLHDIDNSRFCVPGDLLFAKAVMSQGLSTSTKVKFSGMVTDAVELIIRSNAAGHESVFDRAGKQYLDIENHGEQSHDYEMIERLVRSYVAFSGANFPDVFIPLMKNGNVMINTVRPLVIYENMSLHLDHLNLIDPVLEAAGAELEVHGKRGKVILKFVYTDQGEEVGRGMKTMVCSGLRPYDQKSIDLMIETYHKRRAESGK